MQNYESFQFRKGHGAPIVLDSIAEGISLQISMMDGMKVTDEEAVEDVGDVFEPDGDDIGIDEH